MSENDELDTNALPAFGTWLQSLPEDACLIGDSLSDEALGVEVRASLASALNYLFKSLDLIDDGIEGLGYLDDAFIIRWAARNAKLAGEMPESLLGLAEDAEIVQEFLGDLSGRFDRFVAGLRASVVRGRSTDDIVNDAEKRDELIGEIRAWASSYEEPKLVWNEKSLVQIRSFLNTKLPS